MHCASPATYHDQLALSLALLTSTYQAEVQADETLGRAIIWLADWSGLAIQNSDLKIAIKTIEMEHSARSESGRFPYEYPQVYVG